MNDNLLYFPYINIPKNNWTIKSLLYWDNVGIIVPPDFAENPNQFDKKTRDLLKTDLIQQIFPYDYTSKVKNFDNGFLKLINQTEFHLTERQEDFRNGKTSKIHVRKFGEEMLDKLVELKIAIRLPVDWQWYYVESRTARLIMLYLATVIGKSGDYTPATDKLKNLDLSINQNGIELRRNSLRQNILDDLIPYPIDPDLTELRRFKDKYHEELKSFRILIEQTTLTIESFNKKKIQEEFKLLKIAEINDKREKILSDLNQSRFGQITFGTIFGLIGAAVGFSQGNSPLGIFSLLNAVHSAFQGFDNSEILSRDYSYLALVDKKFKQ
ncbi:MAG: hypothetical protein HGB36_11170 [Chlorobiaceae bacterium]|nr:hypothetical protein [Chlorobiaceae bacterium]